MVAAQVHDADDRPEPHQHVGYRQLRTETVRWMKCARSNRKEEQMMTTGTKEKQIGRAGSDGSDGCGHPETIPGACGTELRRPSCLAVSPMTLSWSSPICQGSFPITEARSGIVW